MIAPVRTTIAPHPDWHAGFLHLLPAMMRHFRLAFRHLRPEANAEAIQEATANACVAYRRLALQGRTERAFFSALARFAVKQVNDCRRVGTSQNIRDAHSELAQRQGRVKLERLDRFDSDTGEWQEAVVEDFRTPVFDQVRFRCDFPAWLKQIHPRHRKIARFLALGHRTNEAARRFGVSEGRISQIRGELYAGWKRFQGEVDSLDGEIVSA